MQQQEAPRQNTEEWLKWRQEGVGASDVNVIMGKGHMTIKELYDEKLGLDPEAQKERQKKMEFIASKGHRLEEIGRARFELEHFCEIPSVSGHHRLFPYMRASLDGFWDEENFVWECKYVGEEDFQLVKAGQVLEQYKPQLRHQLYVTGAKKVFLYVMTEEKDEEGKQIMKSYKSACVEYFPEEDAIAEQNVKIFAFWNCVLTQTPPELAPDDTFELKPSDDLAKTINEYKKEKKKHDKLLEKHNASKVMKELTVLKENYDKAAKKIAESKSVKAIKKLKDQVDAVQKKIFADLPHNRVHFKGYKILESESRSVSYKGAYDGLVKVIEANNIVLPTNCRVEIPSIAPYTKTSIKQKIEEPKEEKKAKGKAAKDA